MNARQRLDQYQIRLRQWQRVGALREPQPADFGIGSPVEKLLAEKIRERILAQKLNAYPGEPGEPEKLAGKWTGTESEDA